MQVNIFQRVGNRIRQIRRQAGKTLEGLAEQAGISSGKYMGQIERGEINCTLETLQKIAQALDVEVDAFFHQEQDAVLVEMTDVLRPQGQRMKYRILKMLKALLEE